MDKLHDLLQGIGSWMPFVVHVGQAKDKARIIRIIEALIIGAAMSGMYYGIVRSDLDHLKNDVNQVRVNMKDGFKDIKDDIRDLRREARKHR